VNLRLNYGHQSTIQSLLLLGAGLTLLFSCTGNPVPVLTAEDVGPDPFTDDIATQTPPDVESELPVLAPSSESGVGLYGGPGVNACDKDRLIAYLEGDPAKAAAFSTALGIERDALFGYIEDLSEGFLLTETAVINHGFRDGSAYPFDAVLEAGTAVLVNDGGVPKVRCKCGNPLRSMSPSFRSPVAEGANLVHQFDFEGNLEDTMPTGVSLSVNSATASHGFDDGAWWWTSNMHPGGGLELSTSLIPNPEEFAVGLRVKYTDVGPSWRKILSFQGEANDGGLYFFDGFLQLYPFSVNRDLAYEPDVYYEFILSREESGSVDVYVVEQDQSITKVYSERDDRGETIPQAHGDDMRRFLFFVDDNATTNEWTRGGYVQSIRVWDGAITNVRF
jgi:hypothetical protein